MYGITRISTEMIKVIPCNPCLKGIFYSRLLYIRAIAF